jgi:hypothetical protein
MIQAIEIYGSSGVTVFKPTGVTGEWECELIQAGGPSPAGYWSNEEVARAVVDLIYDGSY